jgi:L-seryl-tRNA(Ser) seleniumtransferase
MLAEIHGRQETLNAIRHVLNGLRAALRSKTGRPSADDTAIVEACRARLAARAQPSQRRIFNLTGTVLHTNLGRALLPQEAVDAVITVMSESSNLEFDVEKGARGERDVHVVERICELTGAEAATVVNNNAAAVLLLLNTLAENREVIVSRGELIEIGGAFRIPDIMRRANCRLVEVGTTNRTHPKDYEGAIGRETALVMRVHASNYEIRGFTAAVPEAKLAAIAHKRKLPFVVDLGSGTLVDLERYGLPHEPTPAEGLKSGADLVTFSGDKLLGGPQAGIIAGRADLIERLNRNPLKRALRLDKVRLAAFEAVLRLYADPDTLVKKLPTLRLLTRPKIEIAALAERLRPLVAARLAGHADVKVGECRSQIGSGSLPVDLLESASLVIRPVTDIEELAAVFRALPVPVIGRVHRGALHFDLRCLEDEAGFVAQLAQLTL